MDEAVRKSLEEAAQRIESLRSVEPGVINGVTKHPSPWIVRIAGAVVVVMIALTGVAWFAVFSEVRKANRPPQDWVTISACTPEDFEDGVCDEPVDPDTLVLDESLTIPVVGQVELLTDEEVPAVVTVSWVHVASDTEFEVLSTPITWDGTEDPYAIEWVPPSQLLSALDDGTADLGQWRIVGRAEPVDTDRWVTYQWDSVKTFNLVVE